MRISLGLFLVVLMISGCVDNEIIDLPEVDTIDASSITEASALCGGRILSDGHSQVTACGVCWNTTQNPTILDSTTTVSAGSGSFSCTINGLNSNTTYYVRAYATNKAGTAYGPQVILTTNSWSLTTIAPTDFSTTTAMSGGCIVSDADSVTVFARGLCWSNTPNPTVELPTKTVTGVSGGLFSSKITGLFSSKMTGLVANTTYYVRAYATNLFGTIYGDEYVFTTAPLVADIDGNLYNTVYIGSQVWMVENLRTTKYRDGTPISYLIPIPNETLIEKWRRLTTGQYLDYDHDARNSTEYGRLYNWYAVNDRRHIAPVGWHVPTDEDWDTLVSFLVYSNAAIKLKESGAEHWDCSYTRGTNESGFTALPAGFGYYINDIGFDGKGYACGMWSSSVEVDPHGNYRYLNYLDDDLFPMYCERESLLSVRCVKDK